MLKNIWMLTLLSTMLSLSLTGCGGSSSSNTPKPEEPTPPIEAPEPPIEAPEPSLMNEAVVQVRSSTGNPIKQAKVIILGQTYYSDEQGRVKQILDLPSNTTTTEILVQVEKAGFIGQSYKIALEDLNHIQAYLLEVKSQIAVLQIQQAQVIEYNPKTYFPEYTDYQTAALTLPANALVKSDGQPATGAAIIEISTWGEQGDVSATLGANKAFNQQLMSAGAVFIQIKNAAGELLQIAPNQKLNLTLELAHNSLNNTALQAGQSLPMWQFDPIQGLWQQKHNAQIIAASHLKHGLAVVTQIEQLDGWQAALPYSTEAMSFVQCQQNRQPVDCDIQYIATLADGSQVSQNLNITPAGANIAVPQAADVLWQARNFNSTYMVKLNTSVQARTILELKAVASKHWLQCKKDQQAVACTVSLNQQKYVIDQDGSYIYLQNTGSNFNWQAQGRYVEPIGRVYRYSAQASSAADQLSIDINEAEYLFEKRPYTVLCHFPNYSGICQTVFDISNYPETSFDEEVKGYTVRKTYQLPLNQETTIYFPILRVTEVNTIVSGSALSMQEGETIRGYWWQEDEFRGPIIFRFVPDFCDEDDCWWTD